ncbi:hypothetical protein PHLCEN_2v9518 [Hermanssonia centrifuga]|uniref:Bud22 domain-containing protein n=1 Tax=Hermanssonia centrifuga TaxID=98765 RepID=A0A2R6NQI6_9APHY|nr:hypothetical protein PHLCEN_2v9518 [Hermanssonia centrifuga]
MVENSKPLVKRKRAKATEEEDLSQKLVGKLHHLVKDVKKAAKKAKTFEMQKLVKKLKGLRAKSDQSNDIADLEAQLEILKRTDHEPFANLAIKTKLRKDKALSENPHVNAAISSELAKDLVPPAAPGSHLAKVQARLLSSKVLASEVVNAVNALKLTLSPESKSKQREEEIADEDDEEFLQPPSKKSKLTIAATDAASHEEDSEGDEDEPRRESLSDEEEVDDDGWESGSVRDGEVVSAARGEVTDDELEEVNGGESSDRSDETEGETIVPPSKKVISLSKPSTSKTAGKGVVESTFLPSLAVGFTRGDSDVSDWSDGEAAAADTVVKKNRRGQRARQAIWEKKYGRNANHVKKQEEVTSKDKRRNDQPHRGRDQHHQGGPLPRGPPRTEWKPRSQIDVPGQERTQEVKPLHPSWEAKRKLKEKESASIVRSQGKKIVF